MDAALGIDIGGTRIRAAIIDKLGRTLTVDRHRTRAEAGARGVIEDVYASCERLLATDDAKDVRGIGVSFGGPVDYGNQRIIKSQHVEGWEGIRFADLLSERFGYPAIIENDANAAAFGEYRIGAGKNSDSMIYLTVSTGIGAGIVHRGSIIRGANFLAGELGHLIIRPGGRLCSCGKRGCLEAYASGSALGRAAEELAEADPAKYAELVKVAGSKGIDSVAVYRAASMGDPVSAGLIEEAIKSLGMGIASAVTLLDVDRVVVGGGVSEQGERFFEPLRRYVAEYAMFSEAYQVQILPAGLGDYSGLVGAAALISELKS